MRDEHAARNRRRGISISHATERWLNALGTTPLSSPPGFRTISGVVMMTTSDGNQPAANAWVDFEPSATDDWPAAFTMTHANGRFSLCTLPEPALIIGVALNNRVTTVTVPPGQMQIEVNLRPAAVNGTHR